MPYTLEFDDLFKAKVASLKQETRNMVMTSLNGLLEKLRSKGLKGRGGAYAGKLWGYPVSGQSAFICELNEAEGKILFIDVIINF